VQWRTPMPVLPARVWWLVLPASLGLLGAFTVWALPGAMGLYRYQP